jgi:hypothetical protein
MALLVHQEEIPLAVESDIGLVVIHRHLFFKSIEHLEGILGDLDILLEAELDPNVGHGKSGGGSFVSRIPFNNSHFEFTIALHEIVSSGGAHDAATHNEDIIIGFAHTLSLISQCLNPQYLFAPSWIARSVDRVNGLVLLDSKKGIG